MDKVTASLAFSLLLATSALAVEVPIAEPLLQAAVGQQRTPAIAGSGRDFFAAWADARAHVYDTAGQPTPRAEWDTYGSRVGVDGVVDPAGGTAITATTDTEDSPAVIWNGNEYVVVSATWPGWGAGGVTFARVEDIGPGDGTTIRFSGETTVGYGSRLAAAWNGNEYLVVLGYSWPTGPSTPSAIRGFLVDRDFRLASSVFQISDSAGDSILPSVSSNGSSFLITWIEAPTSGDTVVRVATVSKSGDVQRQAVELMHSTRNPEVYDRWPAPAAWNGQRYLVTWSDGWSIGARLVDSDGNAVAGAFNVARTAGVAAFAPSVAWNGSTFLVSFAYRNEWFDPTQWPVTNLYATRLRGDGGLLDQPYPLTITTAKGTQTVSAVAASGGKFAVVWESDGEIRSAAVDAVSGAVAEDSLLTRSLRNQSDATAVFDGTDFGVLWTEGSDVLFGRTSFDGRHLDGPGRVIGSGTAQTLLWNGHLFLAVWQPWGTEPLQVLRISATGEALDAAPLKLPYGSYAIASDGSDFVMVIAKLSSTQDGHRRYHLGTYRLTADGTMTPPLDLPSTSEFSQSPGGLAWNGSHYLLPYVQYLGESDCNKCFPPYEYRILLLDRQGKAVGESVQVPLMGSVAGGNGTFLIVGLEWKEAGRYQLVAMSVDDRGMVGTRTPLPATTTTPFSARLVVAWDGASFAVAAGGDVVHVSPTGGVASVEQGVFPAESLQAMPVTARGMTLLLIKRLVLLPPWHHSGGIERYYLEWPDTPRRRAVTHR